MSNLDKTVVMTSGNYMQNIASSLRKYFNITYFGYLKAYEDNTHIVLSTSPEWQHCFYSNFHSNGVCHKSIDAYESKYDLWSAYQDQTTVNAMYNSFNFAHGINIVKKNTDCCEFFGFATNPENMSINNWYLNNIDLLESFIFFFKNQAKDLILLAENDRYILPKNLPIANSKIYIDNISMNLRKQFLSEISDEATYNLTKRQKDCLFCLVNGMTIKEIARTLHLSPKTVEHYLNAIKIRLNANTRSELIKKALQMQFIKDNL